MAGRMPSWMPSWIPSLGSSSGPVETGYSFCQYQVLKLPQFSVEPSSSSLQS